MLTEQGALTLAPVIEQNGAIAGKDIWKIYPSDDGSMLAAISGNGAELYKRNAGETDFTHFLTATNESAFTAVISDKEGNIYAATGPYAKIRKYGQTRTDMRGYFARTLRAYSRETILSASCRIYGAPSGNYSDT